MIVALVIVLVLVAWLVLRDIRRDRKLKNIEQATGARGAPPAGDVGEVQHRDRQA